MFRTCWYVAIIAIIVSVRSSQAANCTATSFKQQLSAAELSASNIIAENYASKTKDQIIALFMQQNQNSVVSFDYTVTQNGDKTNIDYKIICACNETTTTTLPDGTKQTKQVVSTADTTALQKSVAAAITDRTNQVSLQAQQVQAGATDTKCNFNAGGDNYFEWSIDTSSSSYNSALSAGSYKSASDFQQGLLASFRTKLNSVFASQLKNVTFVSQTTSGSTCSLKFRAYFNTQVTSQSSRTDALSKIQSAYYDLLPNFFKSSSSSMSIPKAVQIDIPTVNITSKKAILIPESSSSASLTSGLLVNVTKVSSSSLTKSGSGSGSLNINLGLGGGLGSSGTKTSSNAGSGSGSKSVSVNVTGSGSGSSGLSLNIGSSSSKTSSNTGSGSGTSGLSLNIGSSGSKTSSNTGSASGTGGLSLNIGSSGVQTSVKTGSGSGSGGLSLNLGGNIGSSTDSSREKGVKSVNQKNKTADVSFSLSLGGKGGSSTDSSKEKVDTSVKQKNGSAGGNFSLSLGGKGGSSTDSSKEKGVTSVKQRNGTAGGSLSLSLGGNRGSSTDSSKEKGITSVNQRNKTADVSFSLSLGGKGGSSTDSSKEKGVTSIKQRNGTAGGSLSLSLGGKGGSSTDSSREKGVTSIKQRNGTAGGSLSLSLGGKGGSSTDSSKEKGVTSVKQRNGTAGGSLSLSLGGNRGSSNSQGTNNNGQNSSPNGQTSSGNQPSGQTGSGNQGSGKAPSGNKPSDQSGSGKQPTDQTGSGNQGSGKTPSGNKPSGQTGSGNQGSGKAPSGNKPSGQTGSQQNTPQTGNQGGPRKGAQGNNQGNFGGKQQNRSSSNQFNFNRTITKVFQSQGNNNGPSGDFVVNSYVSGKGGVNGNDRSKNNFNNGGKLNIQTLVRTSGQAQGRSFGVTNRESNAVRDITIDTIPYQYGSSSSVSISSLSSLLAALLYGRQTRQGPPASSSGSSCVPQATFVNYVYEYDIQNQVFNSSFQDPQSDVIQNLQSWIADAVAEEIYKRNLALYVTDEARLIKVIDVSQQYNNRAVLRFYISINCDKNFIPVIRRVLDTVGQNLQNERFATSNKKIDWGNMVLIPITK